MSQWVGTVNNPIDIEVLEESALAMAQSTIQNAIIDAGISKSDLARRMEIGRSGISRILSGSHNLTIKTMARALAGCGYEVRFEAAPIVWNWQSIPQPSGDALPTSVGSTNFIQGWQSATVMQIVLPTLHIQDNWRHTWR
jgi:transcriptional regulator with XRE-family HTH domain